MKVSLRCHQCIIAKPGPIISQITFIFILILFIDSVNRVYRVQLEKAQAQRDGAYVYLPKHTGRHAIHASYR